IISSTLSASDVEKALSSKKERPIGVYVTSPDYLGKTYDIGGIAAVCKKHSVPLIVDNAHGAYLKFLDPSVHPIDLGADMCCDSAHKTLPVLTGGAYLHIAPDDAFGFAAYAKQAMALFASSSPSYLILQSLDKANEYLKDHKKRLKAFLPQVKKLKESLKSHGYTLIEEEHLKITVTPKDYGFTGDDLAHALGEKGVVCEFHDKDHAVLMLTPENTHDDLERIK
ncbi:MAG: aminotransferase class I/II-fold pyridoxal phosphate-dependent enzyme, partial [Clostridia bacterium]|nr:aminotransferase class I/II-fold pyridoxal phosphate-dependent enzyme [Clostridia bacterium]